MNVSRLKLITFDVTNTLLKFRSSPGKQYGEIGALYGVLSDDNRLAANFKTYWYKMNKEHPNFGLNTQLGWENWWKLLVKGTFADSNFKLNEKKLNAISEHLIDLYKTSACWQQCYGAVGLLSYLRSKKLPLGIISNFDPRLETLLKNTKLQHYFQFVITSYEVGVEKPDEKIFRKAMDASNIENLKSEECLHIGDRAYFDYIAARKTAWNSLLVNDKPVQKIKEKHPEVDEEHVFPNLYEVHRHLMSNSPDDKLKS